MKLILDPLKNVHLPLEVIGFIGGETDMGDRRLIGNLQTYFNEMGFRWGNTPSSKGRKTPHVWRVRNGSHIHMSEMESSHIINSVNFLHSKGFISVEAYLSFINPPKHPTQMEGFLKPCIELDWFYQELNSRKLNIPVNYFAVI